jgi:hypothetical protein
MALPDWLKYLPEWLQTLADDPVADELGLVWLSREEGHARVQSMLDAYSDEGSPLVPLPRQLGAAAVTLMTGKVVVATGPKMAMRVSEDAVPSLLLLDEARPDELLIALSADYPPFLWIPAGTTPASVRAAFAGYFPKQSPKRAVLSRVVRYFIGNERMLDTDVHGIENHYLSSPFIAELSWGSACAEDPWPERFTGNAHTVPFMTQVLRNAQQDSEAVYTTTYRLMHSRGTLSIEDHAGMFVVEIRYVPAHSRDVVVALNRRFSFTYPSDMPLDAVAALLGLSLQTEESLKETLADHELSEDHELVLHALASLKYGDFSLANDIRPFLRTPTKVATAPGSLRAATIPPPPNVRDAALVLFQELELDSTILKHGATKSQHEVISEVDRILGNEPPSGWQGPHGPDLLIAGDALARKSLDWIWGDQRWQLVREIPRGPSQIFQREWSTEGGTATIRYGEDHRLGLRFFSIDGAAGEAERARLRSALSLEENQAILLAAESATDPGERAAAILKAARLAPEAIDERWSKQIEAGLTHENLAVRAAALVAAANIAWPELITTIQRAVDAPLRAQADRAILWIRSRNQTPAAS